MNDANQIHFGLLDGLSLRQASFRQTKIRDGGCVVFVDGILNRRPGIHCSPLAIHHIITSLHHYSTCTNGALEGLTKSLALEWGPRLRCNSLSHAKKQHMIQNPAASLPLHKIGQPQRHGRSYILYYLLTASFCTSVVLDVDGGHGRQQYY
jgi:NAD(P)-dependent dehydrogenase (short-subunit alcohol dehydrogenase family)